MAGQVLKNSPYPVFQILNLRGAYKPNLDPLLCQGSFQKLAVEGGGWGWCLGFHFCPNLKLETKLNKSESIFGIEVYSH